MIHQPRARKGFTLAELLIALAILGVIATFTIPKVLSSSTSAKNTAIAKEVASMISGSYSAYTLDNSPTSTLATTVLTPFMNYVSVDVAATAMGTPSDTNQTALQLCSAAPCLVLHNGAFLQYNTANTMGGTANTSAIYFNMDPDGRGTGAGRVTFVQFFDGRITTYQNAGTHQTGGTAVTAQATDPTWIQSWN